MKNAPYHGVLLSGGLGGLLKDYLDAEGLAASDVRSRIVTWEADGRVPITEWVSCLALISGEYPKPALGLGIGRYAQARHLGMLGYLCLSAENFGEVIERISRFYELAWGGIAVPITRTADRVTLRWVMAEGMPTQSRMVQLSHETGLASMVTVVRLLCEAPVSPLAVEMGGPMPHHTELYEAFFHCPVRFNAPAASISFSARDLALPIRTSSSGLREYAGRQAEARLGTLALGDPLLAVLHTVLVKALHEGRPTITHVAKGMGMSRPTLQRRLEERGLSFRGFLDQTRLELARMYLADPRLALTEIAWMLAFSEQSAFSRSFKRWTGCSPLASRRAMLLNDDAG
jgi:AraC-like DNA-binding protein